MAAVVRMSEEGAYCIDLLRQIQAVQAALDNAGALILERHLDHCLTEAIRGEDPTERERVLEEVMDVYRAGTRRRR
jgi:DNA-binding FrmR family transcriptional regulator